MKTRERWLAAIFVGFGISILPFVSPGQAQKQGGSITVGLEPNMPGFDPLKVGVFDTAAETAAAAIFDTLTYPRRQGRAAAKARALLDPF